MFRTDLHIHSALSPCASLEMSPRAIVNRSIELGLDMVAIADHNAIENGFYAGEAAKHHSLKIVFGMEAQTQEEVHILCLFEKQKQAESFYAEIYPFLPEIRNDPEFFGDQVVVDQYENIVRTENRLLMNSLQLSLEDLLEQVNRHQGAVIPSHIDSEQYGLLPALGIIPDILTGSVMEISYHIDPGKFLASNPQMEGYSLISNSDAHYLRDIGRAFTEFPGSRCDIKTFLDACLAKKHRRIVGKR